MPQSLTFPNPPCPCSFLLIAFTMSSINISLSHTSLHTSFTHSRSQRVKYQDTCGYHHLQTVLQNYPSISFERSCHPSPIYHSTTDLIKHVPAFHKITFLSVEISRIIFDCPGIRCRVSQHSFTSLFFFFN